MAQTGGGTFPLTEPATSPSAVLNPPSAKVREIEQEFERALSMPREQAKKLKEVVFNLNDKMTALLDKEKQEFLAAYRAHTRKIQQELVTLRARVAAEESSMQKDERVRQLVNERDGYRQEALHLDEETVVMKKRLTGMAERLETLEDDRNFLIRQLKSAKHKNEVLRSELTLRQSLVDSKQPSGSHDAPSAGGSSASADPAALMAGIDASIGRAELPQLPAATASSSAHPPATTPAGGATLNCSAKVVAALRRELRKTQNQAAAERKSVESLRFQVTQLQRHRAANDLERSFVVVLREVADDIALRRRKAEAATSKRRPLSRDGQLAEPDASEPSELELMLTRDAWGDQPLHLENFTASDRCDVLARFLSRQRQPHLDGGGSGGGGGGDGMHRAEQPQDT